MKARIRLMKDLRVAASRYPIFSILDHLKQTNNQRSARGIDLNPNLGFWSYSTWIVRTMHAHARFKGSLYISYLCTHSVDYDCALRVAESFYHKIFLLLIARYASQIDLY